MNWTLQKTLKQFSAMNGGHEITTPKPTSSSGCEWVCNILFVLNLQLTTRFVNERHRRSLAAHATFWTLTGRVFGGRRIVGGPDITLHWKNQKCVQPPSPLFCPLFVECVPWIHQHNRQLFRGLHHPHKNAHRYQIGCRPRRKYRTHWTMSCHPSSHHNTRRTPLLRWTYWISLLLAHDLTCAPNHRWHNPTHNIHQTKLTRKVCCLPD